MEFLKRHRFTILGFLIVFMIALCFPYTGDDWEWGATPLTFESFKVLLKNPNVNGRYLGNLFVMVMTKNAIIRALIMAVVLVSIVNMVKKITGAHRYAIWLFFLLTPIEVARQSIVWTSGFTNYVISTLFLLLCVVSWQKSCKGDISVVACGGNLLLFFASSFFVENMTIFLLIANLGMNIWYVIKNKKLNVPLIFALVGSVLGTTLMFIQPAYHNVAKGLDSYRSMGGGIANVIWICAYNYIFNIHQYGFFQNVAFVIFIAWLLWSLFAKKEKSSSALQKKTFNITSTILLLYSIYIVLANIVGEWNIIGRYTYILNTFLSTLAIISTVIEMWIVFYKDKDLFKMFLPVILIVGLLAPLLVVRPIGPRNFFMIYVLEIITVLSIAKKADFDFAKNARGGMILVGMLVLFYGSIYFKIGTVSYLRDDMIKSANADESISKLVVPKLPYEYFVYDADFVQDYQVEKYRNRHNIRSDLKFEFLDYDEWVNKDKVENDDLT